MTARRASPLTLERGSGTVEVAVVLATMVVPLMSAIVVMASVQRAMLGTSSAAREAGRAFVAAPAGADPPTLAETVAAEVLRNHGLDDPGRVDLRITSGCRNTCAGPSRRGAAVEVAVTYRVPVLDLPPPVGVELPVRALHGTRVDPYRGL